MEMGFKSKRCVALLVLGNLVVILYLNHEFSRSKLPSHQSSSAQTIVPVVIVKKTSERPQQKSKTITLYTKLTEKSKLILAYTNLYGNEFNVTKIGRTSHQQLFNPFDQCNRKCRWTTDKNDLDVSDAVLFHMYNNLRNKDFIIDDLPKRSSSDQKWAFMAREPQAFYFPEQLKLIDNLFNLTVTFQRDSDVVIPYGDYWTLNSKSIKFRQAQPMDFFTSGFTSRNKTAFWLASNCRTSSRREDYVKTLQKHMEIDVFGKCGPLSASSNSANGFREQLAKDYKFYIAFENSDCDDYISEKFWNTLSTGMIPIVRGHRVDYKKLAPPKSYIHADSFISAEKLAEYLNEVARNVTLFNTYHEWKRSYEAKYKFFTTNSEWMCELCEKVHTSAPKTVKISEFFSEDTRCFTYNDHRGRNRTGEHVEDINRH